MKFTKDIANIFDELPLQFRATAASSFQVAAKNDDNLKLAHELQAIDIFVLIIIFERL